jgi:2-oxoglutarate dehydrogenase E1 component
MLSKQAHRTLLGAGRKELPRNVTGALRKNARALATPSATPPSSNDPFANGTNAYYAEEMYRHWRQDPKSVHASWDVYFSGMDKGMQSHEAFTPPPSLVAGSAYGPALHGTGGQELDIHMKVSIYYPNTHMHSDDRF